MTEKEKKIPNSLTIIINTKLPNYYKLNFDPSMSVPKTKSHTVYFDPLVKYNWSAINTLPAGSPKDAVLSQFFEPNQFDSMINRILSSFFTMQKERTIEEARDQNIINNNIEITLKTLFKVNNIVYLNGAPYTVVNMNWRQNDWEIDKKPLDKLLSQNAHLTPSQIEEQVQKEKEQLGVDLLSGAPVASGAIAVSATETTANQLKEIANQVAQSNNITVQQQQEFEPFVTNKAVLDTLDESFRRLYSKYLQKNNPINYDVVPDLIRDPLTFTLILDYENLSNYISSHNDNNTANLYNTVIELKKQLQMEDKVYQELCIKIAQQSKNFNSKMRKYYDKLTNFKMQIQDPTFDKTQVNKIIDNVTETKANFMKIYVQIAESLMKIYNIQNQYFNALKLLLVQLKEIIKINYDTLIPYFEKPNLVLKCIEYDINILNYLIAKDSSNPSSSSYFDNLERYKQFYETVIVANKDSYINPQINYADEMQKYLFDPNILLTEINQFQLYIYRILINYSYVQLDIWMLYLTTMRIFTEFIKDVYAEFDLETSSKSITEYDKKYPNSEKNFIQKYGVVGLRAKPVNNNANKDKIKWYLVNNEGNPCIPNNASDMLQEKLYIDAVKSQVYCYDVIILFMYLTEITCLRREKILIAEENVQQLNLENSNYFRSYFKSVKYLIDDYNSIPNKTAPIYIPDSINWDINKFINIKNVDNTINTNVIERKIEKNERSNALYLSKIELLQEKHTALANQCNDYIVSLLNPTVSEDGFINFCNDIYNDRIIDEKYTPTSTYWIQRELGNYDFENTNNFNYLMMDVAAEAYYSGIIDTRTPEGYINWIVINNEGGGDCLFSSVRDALNGQLNVENASTTNDYADTVDGTKQFTVSSLRRLVAEHFDLNKYELLCDAAGGTMQNNKCTMNRLDIDDLQNNNRDLYDILVIETGNTKKIRTLKEVKEYISAPQKFWGESISIEILQKILKIKFIIFEMFEEGINSINIGNYVYYDNEKYIVSSKNGGLNNLTGLDGNPGPQNVDSQDLYLANNNILKNLRVVCNDFGQTELYTDYVFLLAVNVAEKGEPMTLHYELIKHTTNENFIFKIDEIPEYIKYFIYYNCYQYLSAAARQSVGFQEFAPTFDTYERQIAEFKSLRIQNKIRGLNEKIKKYGKELNELSGRTNITEEERIKKQEKAQKRIAALKEERDELMQRNQNQRAGALEQEYNQNAFQQNPYIYNPFFNPFFNPNQNNLQNRYVPLQPNIFYSLVKEKDQKSKLTYYVTIDLDLYPGTSANPLQKSAVLCHSRFEEIRHAFADMFGYIYRPSTTGSTVSYEKQYKDDKKKEQDKNKEKEQDIKKGGKTLKKKIRRNKSLKIKN